MGVITTGQTFASGDQVTSTKLNDIANQATFTSAADTTDNATLTVSGGKLKVKDNGIGSTQLATDAVETINIKDGEVTAPKLAASAVSALIPAGLILPYAGASAPTDYFLCDGSAKSRTTYATLFGILGTTYGAGDGSTTFNIPDLRGRVIAGQDDMGGSSANRLTGLSGGVDGDGIGNTGGAETHTLTSAQMQHTNTIARTTHLLLDGPQSVPAASSNATGNISASTASAHNNVQPTIILNYIIKT